MAAIVNRRTDVVIVGGGCASLWTAHALTELQASCVVIDAGRGSLASYASIDHQGWLHSGAWFAAHRQPRRAAACRDGRARILQFAAAHRIEDIVRDDVPCYFLFAERNPTSTVIRRCRPLGIATGEIRSTSDLPEPLLRDALLPWAVEMPDRPIDAQHLLAALAAAVRSQGTSIQVADNLDRVGVAERGDGWAITVNGATIDLLSISDPIDDAANFAAPERRPQEILDQLRSFYPAFCDLIERDAVGGAHAYTVQELRPAIDGDWEHILIDHVDPLSGGRPNLLTFSPERFTSAPSSASTVATIVRSKLLGTTTPLAAPNAAVPSVPSAACYREPIHRISCEATRPRFIPIHLP